MPAKKYVKDYEQEARRVGGCLVHRVLYVSRKVYMLRHGPLITDQDVCHKCDNPYCIKDSHLFVGSVSDNMRDSVSKGRFWGKENRARILASQEAVWTARKIAARGRAIAKALADPKQRKKRSDLQKARWADPEIRARLLAACAVTSARISKGKSNAARHLEALSRRSTVVDND